MTQPLVTIRIPIAAAIALMIGSLAQAAGPMVNAPNMQALDCQPPDEAFRLVGGSAPGLLFVSGERAVIRLHFTKPTQADPVLLIQAVHTRLPDKTDVHIDPYGHVDRIHLEGKPTEQAFEVPGTAPFDLELALPERFGTYALVLRDGQRRVFLGTVARIVEPIDQATFDQTPILGSGNFIEGGESAERAAIYQRMGLRGYRAAISWSSALGDRDPMHGRFDWGAIDRRMAAAERHGLKEIVLVSPRALMPFGKPTPAAVDPDWDGNPYWGQADWNCAPKDYPAFGRFIEAFCERYWKAGQGPVWGLENYNEPWEGGGISGWARDALQYRAIQRTIASAARRVSPQIRLLAASSIMNTEDKFYTEGPGPDGEYVMDQFFDVFTDHYVMPAGCYGPMVAKAHGKFSIDDESWIVISEYLLPQTVSQILASGQKHVLPFDRRAIFDQAPGETLIPTTLPVAIAALNRMISGKPFERLVFLDHLPWAFQFGQSDDPDGLVIMFGQLITPRAGSVQERADHRLWRQVDTASGGTITIDNADGRLRFFDTAGNPVHQGRASVEIPLSISPTYIQSDGGPRLIAERLRDARIEGKRPVELIPHDLKRIPTDDQAAFEVSVHNCLNRRITGRLSVEPNDRLTFGESEAKISLAAGQTKTVSFAIESAVASPGGYPIGLTFHSDAGPAEYAELLQVTAVRRGTKTIDGDLSDWTDHPGLVMSAGESQLSPEERARRPWLERSRTDPAGRSAEIKFAWDQDYLYVAAQVHDPAPQMDKLRQATRDDDRFFHDATSDQREPYKHWLAESAPGRSFAEVPYVYDEKPFDQAWSGQRIHLAFNVRDDWHDLQPTTDRVPYGFHALPDTDHEFSLYLCADGKSEMWRLLSPELPRTHDFPRTPRGALTTGPVEGARHVVRQQGDIRTYEMAIPRQALPELSMTAGREFKMTFQVGVSEGRIIFGEGKAAAKYNALTLHPYWNETPSCQVVWRLVE